MASNLSIVTVTLNNLAGLKRTYDSIAAQADPPLEWVVIDGASRDGTAEWLSGVKAAFPIVWSSERDDGIYDAMNKGIVRARGGFLLFLNAGDYFEGQALVPAFQEPCFLRIRFRDLLGRDLNREPIKRSRGLPLPHQAIVFSRDPSIQYRCDYRFAGDWDFFLAHGLTEHLPQCQTSGWVRYPRGGVTDQNIVVPMAERFSVARRHFGWGAAIALLCYDVSRVPLRIFRIVAGWK
jgi:putative colanic acid biosynthesis glycosyltransferase